VFYLNGCWQKGAINLTNYPGLKCEVRGGGAAPFLIFMIPSNQQEGGGRLIIPLCRG